MQNSGQLSPAQLSLLKNTEFIHQKTAALQQINLLLQNFQQVLSPLVLEQQAHELKNIQVATPKISKGENYLGLPYLVLDYPAHFATPSIFTFRTFFWWGNFFSFTLHLQGPILDKYRDALLINASQLHQSDYYLCINDSPWHYFNDSSNYKQASSFSENEIKGHLKERKFVKITAFLSIDDYPLLAQLGRTHFEKIMCFLI